MTALLNIVERNHKFALSRQVKLAITARSSAGNVNRIVHPRVSCASPRGAKYANDTARCVRYDLVTSATGAREGEFIARGSSRSVPQVRTSTIALFETKTRSYSWQSLLTRLLHKATVSFSNAGTNCHLLMDKVVTYRGRTWRAVPGETAESHQ